MLTGLKKEKRQGSAWRRRRLRFGVKLTVKKTFVGRFSPRRKSRRYCRHQVHRRVLWPTKSSRQVSICEARGKESEVPNLSRRDVDPTAPFRQGNE